MIMVSFDFIEYMSEKTIDLEFNLLIDINVLLLCFGIDS